MEIKELVTKHQIKSIVLCLFFLVFSLFCAGSLMAATVAASYVKETISDNTPIAGGTSFNKTWTIKNSGSSTWTSSYKLKYVSNTAGRLSTINEVAIAGTVSPGNTFTFSVPMKSPTAQTSTNQYREDWKFTNAAGTTIAIGNSPTLWALISVPGTMAAGWSSDTGFRHAETTKQKAIVKAALSGGNNRPAPQSVTGSPWKTDVECLGACSMTDGARMRAAIQDAYNYWILKGKPALPYLSLSAEVQATMRSRLSATYTYDQQTAFIGRIQQVFYPPVPTTDDATLSFLGIRSMCKEFADRMVAAGGGTKKSYGSSAVTNTNIRPGMYAFKNGNAHSAIIVAVYWNTSAQATKLRLAESNWGIGWAKNPAGEVPWSRLVTTDREVPISDYYVVAVE